MNRAVAAVILSFLALGPAAIQAAGPAVPFLVTDLNQTPVESDGFTSPDNGPADLQRVELNGVLYFAAADPAHGRELWRSDGTAAGTWRVSDVRPGPAGSYPRSLTVHKGRLYFMADDGVRGYEIWSTDGTARGTVPLADLCPGPCPSTNTGLASWASSGDRLFFTASKDGRTTSLWKTDGTRQGTVEVPVPASVPITALFPLSGGKILFSLQQGAVYEIWRTDGTPEGTFRLPLNGGFNITPLGDFAVLWIHNAVWRTDGTLAGTVLLQDGGAYPFGPLLVWNGAVYYTNVLGEIWSTNGTAPVLAGGGFPGAGDQAPSQFTPSPCGLLFVAADLTRALRIWRIAGRSGPVEPIEPIEDASQSTQVQLWSAGNRVFYSRLRGNGFSPAPTELWMVDGASCRPTRVTELCGASRACVSPRPFAPGAAGGTGLFVLRTPATGAELWRTDGTEVGTFQVRNIGTDPGSTGIAALAPLGNQVLFAARRGPGPAGLWRSDGTAAGTQGIKAALGPSGFLPAGGFLYFSTGSPTPCGDSIPGCRDLWRTDGTRPGTRLLQSGIILVQGLGVRDGRLLFAAYSLAPGLEPWISDGTAAGTRMVLDLNQQIYQPPIESPPVPGSSAPGPAVWTGSAFLFAADDGLSGRELWATDGTAAGTRQVADIHPPAQNSEGGSDPGPLVRLGSSTLFLFAADDGASGRELWATDGTTAGTRRVRDLRPGPGGSSPHDLVPLGGKVYFVADDGGGEALWASDGTAAGTVRVAPLAYQGAASRGRSLIAVGSRLFLVVDNDLLGSELWTSDGTAAGTRLVRDLRPGPGGSYPQSLTAVDGRLCFAADDGESGLEPWVSDGTAAGTRRLGDLAPGLDASSPGPFVAAGPYVFFGAWDPVHGRELWAVRR
jgi:ELWxxDGT repeat protein